MICLPTTVAVVLLMLCVVFWLLLFDILLETAGRPFRFKKITSKATRLPRLPLRCPAPSPLSRKRLTRCCFLFVYTKHQLNLQHITRTHPKSSTNIVIVGSSSHLEAWKYHVSEADSIWITLDKSSVLVVLWFLFIDIPKDVQCTCKHHWDLFILNYMF